MVCKECGTLLTLYTAFAGPNTLKELYNETIPVYCFTDALRANLEEKEQYGQNKRLTTNLHGNKYPL